MQNFTIGIDDEVPLAFSNHNQSSTSADLTIENMLKAMEEIKANGERYLPGLYVGADYDHNTFRYRQRKLQEAIKKAENPMADQTTYMLNGQQISKAEYDRIAGEHAAMPDRIKGLESRLEDAKYLSREAVDEATHLRGLLTDEREALASATTRIETLTRQLDERDKVIAAQKHHLKEWSAPSAAAALPDVTPKCNHWAPYDD